MWENVDEAAEKSISDKLVYPFVPFSPRVSDSDCREALRNKNGNVSFIKCEMSQQESALGDVTASDWFVRRNGCQADVSDNVSAH